MKILQTPRRLIGTQISIAEVLIVALGLIAAVLTFGYLFRGPSSLFDGTSLLLSLALIFLIGAVLVRTRGPLFAQVAILTYFFLVYVLPRVAQYLLVPDLLTFPFGPNTSISDVNFGLTYVLVGTVLLIIGFLVADRWFEQRGSAARSGTIPTYSVPALLVVFTIVLAIDFYITVWLNVGVFGNFRAEKWNTLVQSVRVLFGVDMVFFVLLVIVLLGPRIQRRGATLVALIALYSLYLAIMGSRVGGLRVVSMVLPPLLVSRGNFRLPLGLFVGFVVYVGALGVVLFPVATQARINMATSRLESQKVAHSGVDAITSQKTTRISSSVPSSPPASGHKSLSARSSKHSRPIVQIVQQAHQEATGFEGLSLYSKPKYFAMAILDRLGVVDYAVQVLTQEGNLASKARFMNFGYAVKSIINSFVPGAVFPEAELSTSRAPSVIYRGFNVGHLSGYFSEHWTAWGLAFMMLGLWGGLAGLLIAGFLLHIAYLLLLRAPRTRIHLASLWLFIGALHFYFTMGLDHMITTAVVAFIQTGVALGAVHLFSATLRPHRGPVS